MNSDKLQALSKRFLLLDNEKQKTFLEKLESQKVGSHLLPIVKRPAHITQFPLSLSQKSQWFLWNLAPESSAYNMSLSVQLDGELDAQRLQKAMQAVVQKHEILRSFYQDPNGQVHQCIEESVEANIVYEDFHQRDKTALETCLKNFINQPFDLRPPPLWRMFLINTAEHTHQLHLVMHHIISDGASMSIFIEDLTQGYVSGELTITEGQISFIDVSYWQDTLGKAGAYEKSKAYWHSLLDFEQSVLSLPKKTLNYNGPFTKANQHIELDKTEVQTLERFAKSHSVTLFSVLLAAYHFSLHLFSGQEQINVGVPSNGRDRAGLQKLIGFFVNTQVFPIKVTAHDEFIELVKTVHELNSNAQKYQNITLNQLAEELKVDRQSGVNPFFQTIFNYLPSEDDISEELTNQQLVVSTISAPENQMHLELVMQASASVKTGANISIEYAQELFENSFIEKLKASFTHILKTVMRDGNLELSQFSILDDIQIEDIKTIGGALHKEKAFKLSGEAITNQALKKPDAIAFTYQKQNLTYQSLQKQSEQLASYLGEHGVGAEAIVALLFKPSLEMYISLVAILKLGATFLPLDPEQPVERLNYILEDARPQLVLGNVSGPKGLSTTVTLFSDLTLSQYPIEFKKPEIHREQLAYIIYTSGSTGQPKGVAISHGAIADHSLTNIKYFGHDDKTISGTILSYYFDASIEQWLPILISGGRVVIYDYDVKEPTTISNWASGQQINLLYMTSSLLQGMLVSEAALPSVTEMVIGGEAFPTTVLQKAQSFYPHIQFNNGYGPTETVICPAICKLPKNQGEIPPIGNLIGQRQGYVIDEHLRLVPKGATGELYISGSALARGYINRPDLSAIQFIANPFSEDGERIYRTGDLVRWNNQGQLEYVARKDHQVKVRGYRIELGEIESALLMLDGVAESAVVVQSHKGNNLLIGYISQSDDQWRNSVDIQQALKAYLPDYMVPSHIKILASLPLSSNGKINRRQLPVVEMNSQDAFVAPEGTLEEGLADIWSQLLAVKQVSRYDNFFNLGGHSLLVIRMVAEINNLLDKHISVKDVFNTDTLAQLAELIECTGEHQSNGSKQVIPINPEVTEAPLSFAQQRLWFIDKLQGQSPEYNIVGFFDLEGNLDLSIIERVFNEIINRHSVLRTVYVESSGQPRQKIQTDKHLHIVTHDLTKQSSELQV